MNRHVLALSFLLSAAVASAGAVDEFLAEIDSLAVGTDVTNALRAVERRLAAGDLPPADAARVSIRRITLLDWTRRGTAARIVFDDILAKDGVPPETKIKACEVLFPLYVRPRGFATGAARLDELAALLQTMPDFKEKGVARGRMLEFVARNHARHNYCDLAYAAEREAADNFASKPDRRVKALMKASSYALATRDTEHAMEALARIEEMPDLPPATVKLAQLRRGLALISADGFQWHPSRQRVAEARVIIDDALAPLGRQQVIPADESFRARVRLVRAEYCSGNPTGAVDIARAALQPPLPKDISSHERADLHILLGDILASIGDWKAAIKEYETALSGSGTDKKTLHKRIATLARRHKDYQRAMQAYADAADLCDRVEGKDEWNLLKRLAGVMSKAIRNKTSLSDSDEVFGAGDETLGAIGLDEP